MSRIHTSLDLLCRPARAWTVLSDLSRWPHWNPAVEPLDTELRAGQPLPLRVHGRTRCLRIDTVVQHVAKGEGFTLIWTPAPRPLLSADVRCWLKPLSPERTHLVLEVRAEGILAAPLVRDFGAPIRGLFQRMAHHLEQHLAQGQWARPDAAPDPRQGSKRGTFPG